MNTLFSLAAIGIIIFLGIWVVSLVLAAAVYIVVSVWRELAVGHRFTHSASALPIR